MAFRAATAVALELRPIRAARQRRGLPGATPRQAGRVAAVARAKSGRRGPEPQAATAATAQYSPPTASFRVGPTAEAEAGMDQVQRAVREAEPTVKGGKANW